MNGHQRDGGLARAAHSQARADRNLEDGARADRQIGGSRLPGCREAVRVGVQGAGGFRRARREHPAVERGPTDAVHSHAVTDPPATVGG